MHERKTGISGKTGKPWSCQRFKLETDDGNQFNIEVWDQGDLAALDGEAVRVTGKNVSNKYEGKTYENFRLNAPPQLLHERRNGNDNDNSERDDPSECRHDSWDVHLTRATNLLAKCHQAAQTAALYDGEDARTLFIECKRYIKDMPAKPINTEPGSANDFSNQE
jgi:hypothetical protein